MSGLETVRDRMRKPVAIIATSGVVLVGGMAALWWASGPHSGEGPMTESQALQPACIALAIDRDSGTTSTQPCAGTPVLLAGQERIAK